MQAKIIMNNKDWYMLEDMNLIRFNVLYHNAVYGNKLLKIDDNTYINPRYISEIKSITINQNSEHDFVLDAD